MNRDVLAGAVHSVGVVLVNWNGGEHTIPCIQSLLAGTVKPDAIVVVDNASSDGSANRIEETFPGIILIRNGENLGFTGANNIGIDRVMTAGCEYVWVLNNDTTVDGACLAALKSHMGAHRDVSACSGKILFAEPQHLIWYAGATYNKWTIAPRHRGEGKVDAGQYERITEVPFISGCCMFMRRETVERVGAFDDRFFAYCEDSDWCLRAMEANRRLDYVPSAVIRHKVSATVNTVKSAGTSGTTSPFSIYITNRNRLFVIRKHAAGVLQAVTAICAQASWVAYYGTALLLLGRFEKAKALALSVHDGLLERLDDTNASRQKPRYLK